MVNNHQTIRHSFPMPIYRQVYKSQTIKDNVSWLPPEMREKINQVVVKAGHMLFKKKDEVLKGRCDSFVVETDVHYPTDTNLLFDAIRTLILFSKNFVKNWGLKTRKIMLSEFKKSRSNENRLQRLKHVTNKDEEKSSL